LDGEIPECVLVALPALTAVECELDVNTCAIWVTADVRASMGLDLCPRLPVKAGILGGSVVDLKRQ